MTYLLLDDLGHLLLGAKTTATARGLILAVAEAAPFSLWHLDLNVVGRRAFAFLFLSVLVGEMGVDFHHLQALVAEPPHQQHAGRVDVRPRLRRVSRFCARMDASPTCASALRERELRRGIPCASGGSAAAHGCETWKQATSYWDTLLGFVEFCGWLPA